MNIRNCLCLLVGLFSNFLFAQDIEEKSSHGFSFLDTEVSSDMKAQEESMSKILEASAVWPIELDRADLQYRTTLSIQLPDFGEEPLVFEREHPGFQMRRKHFTWSGYTMGQEYGRISISFNALGWGGYITMGARRYSLVSHDERLGFLVRTAEKSDADSHEAEHQTNSIQEDHESDLSQGSIEAMSCQHNTTATYCTQSGTCPTECDVIHVLFFIAPDASTYFSGIGAAEEASRIQSAVNGLQVSLLNSGITNKYITYSVYQDDSPPPQTSTLEIACEVATDPWYQARRNEFQADVLLYLVDGTSGHAAAIGPNTQAAAAAMGTLVFGDGSLIFAHEFGHLLGGRHTTDHPNYGPCQYGKEFSVAGSTYVTVMGRTLSQAPNGAGNKDAPKTRIPYFSNPNINFMGVSTGSASRNNALWMSGAFCEVAGFQSENLITFQQGLGDTEDALVYRVAPFLGIPSPTETTNYGDSESLNATGIMIPGAFGLLFYSQQRSFLDFDWSRIPEDAVITEAKLSLYYNPDYAYPATHVGNNSFFVERAAGLWEEMTVTWANQVGSLAADRTKVISTGFPIQDYTSIDVTTMVSDMHANPSSTYGFKIRLLSEAISRALILSSSEHSDIDHRPKLVVKYSLPNTCVVQRLGQIPHKEPQAELSVNIFPNPSQGNLRLQFAEAYEGQLTISDTYGRVVQTQALSSQADIKMNLSDLAKGIYFVRIKAGSHVHTEKIILE